MNVTRRQAIFHTLFGAGMLGLRSLATGIPMSILANPRRALAQGATCANPGQGQFLIMNTSYLGDALNGNVPGTYDDPNIVHPQDPSMAATAMNIGGTSYQAAAPWAAMPASVIANTCFFHMATNTVVHPQEPNVMRLQGAVTNNEMLVSVFAAQLASCLGTVQVQPISLGATNSAEELSFQGAPQPMLSPLTLSAALTAPGGPLATLQQRRDADLDQINAFFKGYGSAAQAAFVDQYATSQDQVRTLSQSVLSRLSAVQDNTPASQITAAIVLFQLKAAPVATIHIPFSGDNHVDFGLAAETAQTISGVATINQLMQQLQSAGMANQVTFASLNVFGRTMLLSHKGYDGRDHNRNHHCGLMIGPNVRGSVIGGVTPFEGDYGALPINSTSGLGDASGDIALGDTMAAYALTLGTAIGITPSALSSNIQSSMGKVVNAALQPT